MIDEHRKLQAKGLGGGMMTFEVNFNESEEVQGCKVVRIEVGKEKIVVPVDEIITIMMIIGNENHQKKLLPVKLTRVKKIERLLTFEYEAKKDYKKGEKITVQAPWIQETEDIEEVFAGNLTKKMLQKESSKSKIYLGK